MAGAHGTNAKRRRFNLPPKVPRSLVTDFFEADLEGVVVRVQRFSTMPVGAQRLVDALTAAGIDHRVALLTGQRAALAPSDYFDLAIGRMK